MEKGEVISDFLKDEVDSDSVDSRSEVTGAPLKAYSSHGAYDPWRKIWCATAGTSDICELRSKMFKRIQHQNMSKPFNVSVRHKSESFDCIWCAISCLLVPILWPFCSVMQGTRWLS